MRYEKEGKRIIIYGGNWRSTGNALFSIYIALAADERWISEIQSQIRVPQGTIIQWKQIRQNLLKHDVSTEPATISASPPHVGREGVVSLLSEDICMYSRGLTMSLMSSVNLTTSEKAALLDKDMLEARNISVCKYLNGRHWTSEILDVVILGFVWIGS
ncbi:hypothetical protein CEXT_205991 [Caerostris extrusa]|uniref:Uncharacterized protein n=1 Tax=Caerostris extrusa TaxID=172846 RepID=A0AAV4TRK7_CAEEX|nr:hypothetical protein CEXT_205991 [Caerostris extrusa]